jgi:hypothetical protein
MLILLKAVHVTERIIKMVPSRIRNRIDVKTRPKAYESNSTDYHVECHAILINLILLI